LFQDKGWRFYLDWAILIICPIFLLLWHFPGLEMPYFVMAIGLMVMASALTVIDPLRSLYLLLFSIVLEVRGDVYGTFTVSSTEIILAIIVAVWLARIVIRRRVHQNWVPLAGWMLLFFACLVATLTMAWDKSGTIKQIFRWLEMFVAIVLATNVVRTQKLLRFWDVFLFVAYGSAIIALLQSAVPALMVIFPPAAAHKPAVLFKTLVRAYGSFEFPNTLAAFLNLGIFLSLGRILYGYKRKIEWIIHLIGLGLLVITLLLTYSRGGWISSFVAFVFIYIVALVKRFMPRRRLAIIGLAILALIIVCVPLVPTIFPSAYQRIISVGELSDETPAMDRATNLQNGLRIVADHPLLGIGTLGSDYEVMQKAETTYNIVDLQKNAWGYTYILYLQIAVEYGLLGLGAFLLYIVFTYRTYFRAVRKDAFSPLVAGILAVMTVYLAHGLFEVLMFRSLHIALGIVLGMGFALSRRGEDGWGSSGED
jgi:O-antigen ligase